MWSRARRITLPAFPHARDPAERRARQGTTPNDTDRIEVGRPNSASLRPGRAATVGSDVACLTRRFGDSRGTRFAAPRPVHVFAMARMRGIEQRPDGLVYEPGVLAAGEERELLTEVEALRFDPIVMHGVAARRTARHFGLDYDYERRAALEEAEPVPEWIQPARAAAARLAGVDPAALVEVLVQRYPEGAQIGWHRDAPMFDIVVGISLLAPARLRFRRDVGGERYVYEVEAEPRSGYVLAGLARSAWQHQIPPTKELRYSITFRTLRDRTRRSVSPQGTARTD